MPARFQVQSLINISYTAITNSLTIGIEDHFENGNCTNCEEEPFCPENCSLFKEAKAHLACFPPVTLKTIFNKCTYNGNFDSIPVSHMSTYSYILECRDLQIDYSLVGNNDNDESLFLIKYGKYVSTLRCFDTLFYSNHYKTILFNTSNIQELIFFKVHLNENLLEAIGEHCQQIKTVKGIDLGQDLTLNSFQKLCYRDFDVSGSKFKNGCCESLEYFQLLYSDDFLEGEIERSVLNDIVTLLLSMLSNLKSLSCNFEPDCYLNSLAGNNLIPPKSNLEHICLKYCYNETLSLLELYFPNMKILEIRNLQSGSALRKLHTMFPQLEQLSTGFDSEEIAELYSVITTPIWSNMKELDIVLGGIEIELSDLAEHLPVIGTMYLRECGFVNWNRKVAFQKLTHGYFRISPYQNISWVASFASCIKKLEIFTQIMNHKFDKDSSYNSFMSVLFPNLKSFAIRGLHYDLNLIIDVINRLPALVNFNVCPSFSNEEVQAIKQYIVENNYNCTVVQSPYW